MTLRWLARALTNRFDQLEYVAADNASAAAKLDLAIERQIDVLADNPYLGREGRVPGTRELVINRSPYIAVYRVRDDAVEILRLLHGAQQWPPQERSPKR